MCNPETSRFAARRLSGPGGLEICLVYTLPFLQVVSRARWDTALMTDQVAHITHFTTFYLIITRELVSQIIPAMPS